MSRSRTGTASDGAWLLFAPWERTASVVNAVSQLGVARITRILPRRPVSGIPAPYEEWAREAAKQAGRETVPVIDPWTPLFRAVAATRDAERRLLFCDEGGEAPFLAKACRGHRAQDLAVLVGPRHGFTKEERSRLRAMEHVVPVSLGPYMMAPDVAAIAAVAVVQQMSGTGGRE